MGGDADARHFITTRARFELEERGEIIELLGEVKASGSTGLWELDSKLVLVNVSNEMALALGSTAGELVGRPATELLDPKGQGDPLLERNADAVREPGVGGGCRAGRRATKTA